MAKDYTRYQDIPVTKTDLNWADLITVDLSKFDQPNGKCELADQLKHAISTVGFFYVTNFGLSEGEVDEQFAIAKDLFDLPQSEKQQYRVDPTKQGFFGWKPKESPKQQFGSRDNLELYDDPKWNDVYGREGRPSALMERKEACEKFQRHLANYILRRLLILSAIIMKLEDEEMLWKLHDYESRSQCHLRYMLYHPRSSEELAIMRKHKIAHNVYGHTDFGTFTLLMRQPVAALQVRPYGKNDWKWVKRLKGSITVNVADTLSFLTGGYLESSIHCVVLSPEDQRDIPRYGVIYFSGPNDDVLLEPVKSPLLQREKIEGNHNRALPPAGVTAGEWVRVRFGSIDANYANNKDNKVVVNNVEVPSYA